MMSYAIPATKANRLFWLGRYVERVYLSLHLLRRCYDKMIDGDAHDFEAYYRTLDIGTEPTGTTDVHLAQLYDENNPCSLLSGLERANDNAIVLREEITSESLSYVQMSLSCIRQCARTCERNITVLQPVTDYLLAFFGSIDERVFDDRVRGFIKMGKLIEHIDLHIRFNYPFFRIDEAYASLKRCMQEEMSVLDPIVLQRLDEQMNESAYEGHDATYKNTVLHLLNHVARL